LKGIAGSSKLANYSQEIFSKNKKRGKIEVVNRAIL
jgi:hypothetical protein